MRCCLVEVLTRFVPLDELARALGLVAGRALVASKGLLLVLLCCVVGNHSPVEVVARRHIETLALLVPHARASSRIVALLEEALGG